MSFNGVTRTLSIVFSGTPRVPSTAVGAWSGPDAGLPRIRAHAHLHVVVRAVVAALHLDDEIAAGERARRAQRVHDRLGTGVAEAHHVDRGNAIDDDLRQSGLGLIRRRKRGAEGKTFRHGGDDRRVSVAVDQGCVVVEEIDVGAAVGVLDATTLPFRDHQRVRRMKRHGAGIATGHHPARGLMKCGGAGRAGPVIGNHLRLDFRARARIEV